MIIACFQRISRVTVSGAVRKVSDEGGSDLSGFRGGR